jgi:DNA repair exonuclease SbcCD nuclease subunit
MTILISGDWHLDASPLAAYREATIRHFVPKFIKEHKVDLLLFLGDVTEAKDEHRAELTNLVVNLFADLSNLCPIVCLEGNHDRKNPEYPYFKFLSRLGRVVWVGQPTLLQDIKIASAAFLDAPGAILLPHTHNPDKEWAGIDFKEVKTAFTHQHFTGAVADTGFQLTGGTPLSVLPEHVRVISGDLHAPQVIDERLTYVGSPTGIDFGDEIAGRRMLLLRNSKLTSLSCEGLPSKRLIEINLISDLKAIKDLIKDDLVKVRIALPVEDAPKWPEMVAEVRAWGLARGVTVHLVQPVVIGLKKSMTIVKAQAAKSDADLLKEYAAARAVGADTLSAGLKYL